MLEGLVQGDLIVSELVLFKIFNGIVPDLEAALLLEPKPAAVSAVMEVCISHPTTPHLHSSRSCSCWCHVQVVVLLNGLLPMLSPEIVLKDYLQPSRNSGSCLPRLLAQMPLIPSYLLIDGITNQMLDYATIDG